MAARFLGEQADGKIRPPGFVESDGRHGYREWVHYWKEMLSRPEIKTAKGVAVPKSSPEFLDVLRSKSKLHFMLVDTGSLMDSNPADELSDAADELFETLVETDGTTHVKEHARHLRQAAAEVFERAGLTEKPYFKRREPVPCRIGTMTKEFTLDYAFGDDVGPWAVFQYANVTKDASACAASLILQQSRRAERSSPVKAWRWYTPTASWLTHSPESPRRRSKT